MLYYLYDKRQSNPEQPHHTIFCDGDSPSESLAEQLYNEFLKSDVNDRMTTISQRMHARIDAVRDTIDTAMTTANAYSGSLQSTSSDLGCNISVASMQPLAEKLLAETRHMQGTNRSLEEKLQVSRDDIAALQRDLDDVQRESVLDPLTKIANRKSFDEGLDAAISEASSSNDSLCLMLVDIDHSRISTTVMATRPAIMSCVWLP
ncbi:MAG: GGDEF domain-containing protein [Candidatus Devosia symbiotica]|nr:GGDEF domain-containing protein [Candidatus Devosia symbiotica]